MRYNLLLLTKVEKKVMYRVYLRTVIVIGIVVFALSVEAAKKTMSAVELINIASISDANLIVKKNEIIYAKSEANWDKNRRVKNYWRYSFLEQKKTQLTYGDRSSSKGSLSVSGRYLSFMRKSKKSKFSQIFILPLSGGEAKQVSQLRSKLNHYVWGRDDKTLILLIDKKTVKSPNSSRNNKNDIVEFSEKSPNRELWVLDLETEKLTPLVKGDFSVRSFNLSSDSNTIVYTRSPSASRDDSLKAEVWLYDLSKGAQKKISLDSGVYKNIEISPSNKDILFTSWRNQRGEKYQEDNLFTLSLSSGLVTQLLGDFDHEILDAHYSSDRASIYFLANLGVHSELFRYQLDTQKIVQLTDGEHQIRDWHYVPESDSHLLQIQNAENKGDYWLLSLNKSGSSFVQVTNEFDDLKSRYHLPEQQVVRWHGEDGQIIEGLLTLPLNYRVGKKFPLIVQTHGGPRTSDKFGVFHSGRYLPVLAANGYLVLQPNYRGSTGYGDKFVRDMVGNYFNQAHKDVIRGVDYLIEKGIADPKKLGKMGWSAGGHMTNKIVTYTDRFKAASSGAGAANWISMFSQSDTRVYRTPWFGGTPWQKDAPIDNYWNNSPLKDIHKVTTPTLILVGDKDNRVPKHQSIEFYRGLKENGVESKLYIAPREPHGWKELRHKLFKINVELDWFKKHIEGKSYQWEQTPSDTKTNDTGASIDS